MCSIHFKILFPPASKDLENGTLIHAETQLEELKKKLEIEGFSIEKVELLNSLEYGNQYPNIYGFKFSVHAFDRISWAQNFAYSRIRRIWSKITNSYNVRHTPLLVLCDRSAFHNRRTAEHCKIEYRNIKFGVLPFPGSYVHYEPLPIFDSFEINFYHDTRTMEIIVFEDFLLTISYQFIRNIFVEYTPHSAKIYFDLLHSPLLHRSEVREGKQFSIYSVNIRKLEYEHLSALAIGKANVLFIEMNDIEKADEVISRLHYRCGDIDIHYGHICDSKRTFPSNPFINFPYFSCNYLMTAILNRNFCIAEQCRSDSSSLLRFPQFTECNPLERALSDILFNIDSGIFCYFSQVLPSLYNYYLDYKEDLSFYNFIRPEKSRLIRRVIITPTRLLLYPPEIMFENRVLRNFDSDFALRVTFRDDNMSRLSFVAHYSSESIFDNAIKNPMTNGIRIGDRLYEFLAWSNSQIRDHGVWLYAKDSLGYDVRDIRKWMGDFSHIQSVPKYMARMGQCFSQTVDTVSVPFDRNHVRIENDIEGGYDYTNGKPYCFSDGIGKISVPLAKKVHDVLGHDKHCSAFQIRYGGYKGMLVVDPTLVDADIVFRKSMVKFESPRNTRVEIAKISAPSPLQLNRPFITILNDMGIKPPIFLRMQEDMIRTLTDMLLYEEKAAEYLMSKTPSKIFRYKDLCGSGIGLTTEPFFRSLLLALHSHNIENIKTRANIAVDPKDGRNMFGVLDETGQLQYGEVFVQYTTDISYGETTKDTKILTGTVLITKNPCMHPGDVRKFQAVDIPALHHIVDCVVFPQKGQRPHANEMGGSDLDGDEYTILWKKELVFYRSNHAAGDYPSLSAPAKPVITEADMVDFLVEYIKNDQVGVIANAHLAHADQENIFSPKCLQIASKFSIAVDFAKNGTKAHLHPLERPKDFPDFMEKSYKKTYKSVKALGKMFRVCKDFESESQTACYNYTHAQVDPALIFPGWENYESDAIRSRDKYNMHLCYILQTYGVRHEAEAFSGAFSRLHCRFQERKDKAEVEKVIVARIKTLCKHMKSEFLSELEANANVLALKLLQKASAWYMVTYRDPNKKYLSFPWIVSEYLANIRVRSQNIKPFCPPILTKLDVIIEESANANFLITLPQEAVSQLRKFHFYCEKAIVERALRVMIQWAVDRYIIQDPGYSRVKGFLFIEKFVRLFLHIASVEKYVQYDREIESNPAKKIAREYSSAALCLAFLHFCVSLRFCNKNQVKEFVPFDVYKYKWLSMRAMSSYHSIAITGAFDVLSFDSESENDYVEMKPEHIESSIFGRTPISEHNLRLSEENLIKVTGAKSITLRETRTTKKVIVNAYGTIASVNILKSIIRKPLTLQEYVCV